MIGAWVAGVLGAGVVGVAPWYLEGPAQLDDNTKPFFQADATSGDLVGALLLCRVDVVGDKGWDTFGAVDIRATFTAGSHAPVSVWGPEDRSSAIVGLPAFDVKSGEKIKVIVEDRDVTENELIARGSMEFAGKTPFRMDLDDTQIECRAMPHALAASRAKPAIARAAKSTAALEAAEPNLSEGGLGFPEMDFARALGDAREAEAWIGPDDADVRSLNARMTRSREVFTVKARAAVDDAKKALPPPGERFAMADLGLIAKITKGPAVTLELTPSDKEATFSDEDVAGAVTFLSARGAGVERSAVLANQTQASLEQTKLAAGAVRSVRLKTVDGAVPDLLRVDDAVVRVR